MRQHRRTAVTLTAIAGLAVCPLAACSSTPAPTTVAVAGAPAPAGSWAYPNGDLANTRDAAGSAISSASIGKLREAWTFKLAGAAASGVSSLGSLAAAPVVTGGTVYLQDLYANVYAISLVTGKLKWEYAAGTAEKSGPGPDGVAVAGGVVYGDTSTAAFALSAATGAARWKDDSLLTSGQGSFEIQPQVSGGRVYLASAYGSGPGGGVPLALDAASGKKLWSFSTVTGGEAAGVKAVGLGSGGAWETPLVSADGSTVTFGTGNPYQSIGQGLSHPSRQLYTDSEVALDAATGALRWYYQAVPDDFLDWDMQLSPIAATVGGVPAVIGGGKMGDVYAMNAATGKLLWKTPVGVHIGDDNDSVLALSRGS
jgi:glucose dehydrogenase